MGFETPTPIQEQGIPILLKENPTNFIGLAQTGTGKTAAFGLPLIELIDIDNPATQALIMAPTRELGQQTAKQLVEFASNNRKLNVEVVYGGANISMQIKALRSPTQILVATPGRLLDLIKRRAVKLDNVRYVVLDEADEMLNMGFKEDIDSILSHTMESRVTWLFSATMPADIRRLVKKYMANPREVSVNTSQVSNEDITHQYITTKMSNKIPALRRFLDIQPEMRGIMFCRTKILTQQLADELGAQGYGVEALHGDLSQAQRDAVMKRFKKRSMQLLIATDVAARGIDVNDLTHVIHHTLPDQLESYTHRSGRTGRAGKKGVSLAFVNSREGRKVAEIEKRIRIKFERIEVPSLEQLRSSRMGHWAKLILNTKIDDQADEILQQLMQGPFADMSREDLLRRLITTQLDHLTVQNSEEGNLNESDDGGGGGGRRDRGSDRRERSGKGDRRDRNDRNDRSDRGRGDKSERFDRAISGRPERRERVSAKSPVSPRRERPASQDFNSGEGRAEFNRYFVNIGSIDGVTKGDLLHYLSDVSGVSRQHFGQLALQKNCAYFDVIKKEDAGLSQKFKGVEIEGRSIRVNRDDEGNKRSRGEGDGEKAKGKKDRKDHKKKKAKR